MADVVFMGGSFTRRGGQNPIEPAAFGKAILHGPHVFNFAKIYRILDQEQAAMEVASVSEMTRVLKQLLKDEKGRTEMGEKAFAIVERFRGATQRHVEWVLKFLELESEERKCDVELGSKLFPPVGTGR